LSWGDAVGDGLVASLAKPGGNITGLTFIGPQLVPKRLALLKEALPTASKVVALWQPSAFSEHTMTKMMNETEAAAQTLGLHLQLVSVQGPDALEQAFSKITDRTDALFVLPSAMLFAERRRIVDLASKFRLPVISMSKEFVEVGGLMSYGVDITDFIRRAAPMWTKSSRGLVQPTSPSSSRPNMN
jgi:putative ABC transport system substrate-binding protein